MGDCWLIQSRSYNKQVPNITHHTTHITYCIYLHIFFFNRDQNSFALYQFIKTDPEVAYQIVYGENPWFNDTMAYVDPKISLTKM